MRSVEKKLRQARKAYPARFKLEPNETRANRAAKKRKKKRAKRRRKRIGAKSANRLTVHDNSKPLPPQIETSNMAGATEIDQPPQHAATPTPAIHVQTRPLVFHYHLFKNAGTSVDELLRLNFDQRWTTREFHGNRRENAAAIFEFITYNPHLQAVSSHTALLPAPEVPGVSIFPVVFIRHPIDRLRSAYEFERRQNANTAGAHLAKMHDFAGYLRELLRNPRHRQIRNFQTLRLSQNELTRKGSELHRAEIALDKLPFVGLVEQFEESVNLLQIQLRVHFTNFQARPVHRNISFSRHGTLPERLASIEATLGNDLYAEIRAANADDLVIYEIVTHRFQAE